MLVNGNSVKPLFLHVYECITYESINVKQTKSLEMIIIYLFFSFLMCIFCLKNFSSKKSVEYIKEKDKRISSQGYRHSGKRVVTGYKDVTNINEITLEKVNEFVHNNIITN